MKACDIFQMMYLPWPATIHGPVVTVCLCISFLDEWKPCVRALFASRKEQSFATFLESVAQFLDIVNSTDSADFFLAIVLLVFDILANKEVLAVRDMNE